MNKEFKTYMDIHMWSCPPTTERLARLDVPCSFDDSATLSDSFKARSAKYYGSPLTAALSTLSAPSKMAGEATIYVD